MGKPHGQAVVGVDSVEDMTSPDFMYPQPTDDELAAQQPFAAAVGSPRPAGPSSSDSETTNADSHQLGRLAVILTIIAVGLSLIASIVLGTTIGPIEAETGRYFTDAPDWYRNLAIGLFGLQALCTALGITGLIMGIVSIATGRGRTQGIIASAVALVAPFISLSVFIVLAFMFV